MESLIAELDVLNGARCSSSLVKWTLQCYRLFLGSYIVEINFTVFEANSDNKSVWVDFC
jgi:hypothetical protein